MDMQPDNLEIPIISRLYTAAKEQANWQYTSWVGIHIQGDWLISNWIASHEGFEHNYELTTCKGVVTLKLSAKMNSIPFWSIEVRCGTR